MKSWTLPLVGLLGALSIEAAPPTGHYDPQASVLDSGGTAARSGRYSQTASLGGIGGPGAEAAGRLLARSGYPGQWVEATRLELSAEPGTIPEAGQSRLSGVATLDDGTRSLLSGGDLRWFALAGPVASIDAAGVLTSANVFKSSTARVEGRFPGATGQIELGVLNTGGDDYGLYVHDQIRDAWQVSNFGENNPLGVASADPDGDGQSNLAEFRAGVSPTNAASRFSLEIAPLPESPREMVLLFSPRLTDRSYEVEYSADLGGSFVPLRNAIQLDLGDTRLILDSEAAEPNRFYRVRITLP